jgi:hypothetical protein
MAITNSFPKGLADSDDMRKIILVVKKYNTLLGSEGKSALSSAMDESSDFVTSLGQTAMDVFGSDAGFATEPTKTFQAAKEQYRKTDSQIKRRTGEETHYAVCLPFPNELSDDQSHKWEEAMTVVGEALTGLEDKEVSIGKVASVNIKQFMRTSNNILGTRKPIANPAYFQDYTGSNLRRFKMSWKFIPNNKEEAEEVMLIVYNLKKFTLPSSSGVNKLLLLAPYIFDIQIMNENVDIVTRMKRMVCENMQVSWGDKSQFYPDGMPKSIDLSLSFAERELLTSEDL